MTNARILGVCGLAAAALGTLSGTVGAAFPRAGFILSGAASALMLVANAVLVFRRDEFRPSQPS